MNRYERLTDKIEYQSHLVYNKFLKNQKPSRELTNAYIQLALFQYKEPIVQSDSENIERTEWLREALSHLFKYEMEIIKMRHWEGKTHDEIAVAFKKTRRWAAWRLNKIYDKMRKYTL